MNMVSRLNVAKSKEAGEWERIIEIARQQETEHREGERKTHTERNRQTRTEIDTERAVRLARARIVRIAELQEGGGAGGREAHELEGI